MENQEILEYGLDPRAIEAVSRPTLEAETLPPECYWSPSLYQRELDRIFARNWICVGRVEDVPNVGDYITTSIGREPLAIVRDGTEKIRAHYNVCRHRRCALVEGTGSVKSFRCPYHGWLFALDGTLRGTPAFKETKNFDKADYPLIAANLEIWEGFILVNMDHQAVPFAETVSESSRWGADRFRMGDMVTTRRWEYQVECNWKIYVENFTESYHVPWVHPETFQLLTPMKQWVEFPDLSDQPWAVQVGQNPGLTFSDSGDALFPVTPELAEQPIAFDGMPVWLVYPTMMVISSVDALVYYAAFPEGPERSRIIVRLCLPEEAAGACEAGDPATVAAAEEYKRNVHAFLDEDNKICTQQQIGLGSVQGDPGRYCKHEGLAQGFDRWVAKQAYGVDPLSNGNGG